MDALERIPRWLRTVYGLAAAVSAAHLLLLTALGVLARHGKVLGLTALHVSRAFLPHAYRAGQGAVRADIFVSDAFSALLHGRGGGLVLDVLAAFWLTTTVLALILFLRALRRPAVSGPQPVAHKDGIPHPARHSAKVVELRRR